ncbi:2-hydroxyacid dehydrogenase [Microbacterium sp. CIAB417]|uniref:2-hydroxyacid dehydrogenase n=1 Tax=Microbacterium sp. CIAB417 TaxID=2860287 RepID=UPI001FACF410|nr:2-hydroxyacid dehydrogenase [Microbacterium sp. CIAB417]
MSLVVTVPTDRLAADIAPVPDGVEVLIWDMQSPAPRERLDIVVPPYMNAGEALGALEGVEVGLVQGQMIGYESIIDILPEGQRFANAATVHETATGEQALALTLAAQRHIPEFVRSQDRGAWERLWSPGLADRRVLLLGFGGVGQAIAERLAGFEARLTVVARTARTVEHDRLGTVEVHAIDELPALLPDAEIVILGLPDTSDTRHLIDDAALSALPDGALVVNVGRGVLIDTDALVDHATRGRIRAALDVVDPEPLPAGHPLWTAPGVLIAPHVGGSSDAMHPRIARVVRTQIERLLAGEPPINVVLNA